MPKPTPAKRDAIEPGRRSASGDDWLQSLHPRLLEQLKHAALPRTELARLRSFLHDVDASYRTIDGERRGITQSMRLIADEAQALASEVRREGTEHLQLVLDHLKDVVIVTAGDGTIRTLNPIGERVFGCESREILGQPIDALLPQLVGSEAEGRGLRDLAASAGDTRGGLVQAEIEGRRWDGRPFPAEVAVSRAREGDQDIYVVCLRDVSERHESERLAAIERDVFEKLTSDASLADVLAAIAALLESDDTGCAIGVLMPDAQAFSSVVAPRLPPRLRALLERSDIDIRNGAAAAAVYLGRPVLVENVETDPHWQRRREAVLEAGFSASWAVPIRAASERTLGALCVFRKESGLPGRRESAAMARAAQLAGFAIERRLAEDALRSSEAKFRGLFESVIEGVYQSGRDGRLHSVNPAFVELLGYDSAEEIYALPSAAMLYWTPADRHRYVRRLDADGFMREETALRRRDGEQIFVMESARAVRDVSGRVIGYEGVIADITARKRAEQEIFAQKERAQVTLQSIGDAVISADAEGRIDYLNPVAESLTGWTLDDARGRPAAEVLTLVSETSRSPIENPLLRALAGSEAAPGATEHPMLVTRSGQEIAVQESAAPIRDRQQQLIGAVMVFHDVTKERRLRRALSYQASHDALTGLINRREFDARVQLAVRGAQRGESAYVLLYIDLDQFKVVNDTCGHQAGDRLLRDITGILQTRVRVSDTIARLGGDEFGILLEGCTLEQATRIADGIREAIRDYRFVWGSSTLSVGASIGVVQVNRETESVASVLSAADIACYAAKDEGRNRIYIGDTEGYSDRHREMHWVARVTRATEENRFELFYQPIVALSGPQREFHELTIRMRDDDGGLVMPGKFIPAAERYNVMAAVDRWVVTQAIALLRTWPVRESPLLLAVNLSGASLNDQSFVDYVLQSAGEPAVARHLCFEITETAAVTNLSNATFFMSELKGRGCRFALDDFGSGLSSFMYLKTLPVDFLKIEGQFISRMATDPVDRSMVEAVCKVGRALGIHTIAECVESEAALDELRRIGVEYAQGFHLARPAPLAGLLRR